jgi:hypothetical protein
MSVLGAIIGKSYPELKEKALWLLSNLVANGSQECKMFWEN